MHLKIGRHTFQYKIDESFFEAINEQQPIDGEFEVGVEMERGETMLLLEFEIKGIIIGARSLEVFLVRRLLR